MIFPKSFLPNGLLTGKEAICSLMFVPFGTKKHAWSLNKFLILLSSNLFKNGNSNGNISLKIILPTVVIK